MQAYTETLQNVGESILQWSDPETKFRGHTEVRFPLFHRCLFVGLLGFSATHNVLILNESNSCTILSIIYRDGS
jgi:hypothetical protein